MEAGSGTGGFGNQGMNSLLRDWSHSQRSFFYTNILQNEVHVGQVPFWKVQILPKKSSLLCSLSGPDCSNSIFAR